MGSNYFDDMSAAIDDEEELDEEDLDDDDEDTDDADIRLDDGVSHSKGSSYDDILTEESRRKNHPRDMSDIEGFDGPSLGQQSNQMDFPENDLSMSILRDDGEIKHKKKNKLLIVALVVAVSIVSVSLIAAYSIYQRDEAPSIREVHIESDNFDDHSVAQYGNMITLTFSFSEDITGLPTVIIMDRQVEVFGEGKTFYAKYFVQDQDNDDQLVSFTIKDYKDSLRKTGPPVTSTTDESKVVILGYHFS